MVSSLFWFMGMIPDFALVPRPFHDAHPQGDLQLPGDGLDRFGAGNGITMRRRMSFSAGLCTLLVFTVSSIVGLDFCTSQIAGWHATIFRCTS